MSYPRGHKGTPEQRFWAKVDKSGECWVWTASGVPAGYGLFYPNGPRSNVYAHRYSYELAFGPIPAGMLVRHDCDNPPCVRPSHLQLGAQLANIHDAMERGRHVAPPRWNTKITAGLALEIRARYALGDITHRALASYYGVSDKTIGAVVRGERAVDAA